MDLDFKNKIDYKIPVEIYCEINEIFAKIKVTQKIKLSDEKLLNLKVCIKPNIEKVYFSSFSAEIGTSIKCNSKVTNIYQEDEYNNEPIISNNTIIYISQKESSIPVIFENLPQNEELILITEFIQFIKNIKTYEFMPFTEYPSFSSDYYYFKNELIRAEILVKMNNEIINVKKEINPNNFEIIKENYPIKDNKKEYLITYKIPDYKIFYYSSNHSKIYFEVGESKNNVPIIYTQKSYLNRNQRAYVITYKENIKMDNLTINPALYIFLIEKSSNTNNYIGEIFRKIFFFFNVYHQILIIK